ncbi:HNH endonuclease [Arthrobacter sp. MYb227]|uniref:HNH endonuclease n=1 Tax=Arthrobacter sp. MYb227 TaxID=1848601 RepID=UPI000CFE1AF0|nr:DUF222 domain-containing protein [Arthrobacter sp. MYb227]PQZ93512.1 HNH endonuclease [Arthrobacter sp. MYb227]
MFEGFEDEESMPTYLTVEEAGDILAGHTMLPQRPLRRNPSARNIERSNDRVPEFLEAVRAVTAALPQENLTEGDRISRIAELERTKSALAAAQTRETWALEQQVITRHHEESKYAANPNYGVGSEVALAKMEAPTKGSEFLGFSRDMLSFMPCTFAALQLGTINEKMAKIIVSETKNLDPFDRELLDAEFMDDPESFQGVGLNDLTDRVKRVVLAVDNTDQMDRHAKALHDRHIRFWQTPDRAAMRFSGELPIEKGVILKQALQRETDKKRDKDDRRTNMQVAADTLVDRAAGLQPCEKSPVNVTLIMTDRTLFQGDSEPAYLSGYGVISAEYARYLISGGDRKESQVQIWIRRLFTAPTTGELIALDSKARRFPDKLKQLVAMRDQYCRTPYCTAPIKHFDHVYQAARGGESSLENCDGRCQRCNNTKEIDGWEERVLEGPRHTIEIKTPSGQIYRSTAPPLPGSDDPDKRPLDTT